MNLWRRQNARPALQVNPGEVDFGLAQTIVPVSIWEMGGANRYSVEGTLTLGGRPVAGARIAANDYTISEPTGSDGSFIVGRDKTVLDRTRVHVTDALSATVDGRALSDDEQATLMAAEAAIETAFVITLDEEPALRVGQENVAISGVLTFADGTTPVPAVALWGYHLSGIVRDLAGEPQQGVYVSISDDEGETWALSNQTGEDGRYELRFFPIPNSPYTVRIARDAALLTSEGELQFAPDTSATLDLVADDDTGRVIGTGEAGAFAPEAVQGAEYVGYVIGLAVDDHPVESAATWPDADGRFTLTISQVESADTLSFFQERVRFFSPQDVVPGGDVPAEIVPETLAPNSPRDLPPFLTPQA